MEFTYQAGTGAQYSCSFLQNDQMYIVGGYGTCYWTQISIVSECDLRLIGQLPHAFQYGACSNYYKQDGTQEALLCFGYADQDGCIRY